MYEYTENMDTTLTKSFKHVYINFKMDVLCLLANTNKLE